MLRPNRGALKIVLGTYAGVFAICGAIIVTGCTVGGAIPASGLSQTQSVIVECEAAAVAIDNITPYAAKMTNSEQVAMTGAIGVIAPLCSAGSPMQATEAQAAMMQGAVAQLVTIGSKYKTGATK
jgi:hypothetical protein